MALTIVMLFVASMVPTMKLSVLAVTSAISAFVIIETGIKFGTGFYLASSVLALVLVPNKTGILPYIMFFGIYPVIKYFAEKNIKPAIQISIKLAYFIIVLFVAYFMMFEIFFGGIKMPGNLPVPVIFPVAVVMFLLLDYILTVMINIYFNKIHSKL